ncbi:hypothetical protein CERSUDRAFT_119659, partial [Gelatoporia subvermispora B]
MRRIFCSSEQRAYAYRDRERRTPRVECKMCASSDYVCAFGNSARQRRWSKHMQCGAETTCRNERDLLHTSHMAAPSGAAHSDNECVDKLEHAPPLDIIRSLCFQAVCGRIVQGGVTGGSGMYDCVRRLGRRDSCAR